MKSIDAIIALLENARYSDFTIDEEISRVTGIWNGEEMDVPSFTSNLNDARSISNWLLVYASDIGADGLALATLADPGYSPPLEATGMHSSLEIALCIAGLKARQLDEGK